MQISKNGFLVKKFSKSDMCLKRSPKQGFSIPNNRFLIRDLQTSKFSFFPKKCTFSHFSRDVHVDSSKQHSELRSSDIIKPLLQGYSSVKMEAFSYSSYQNWRRILKNRKSPKKIFVFFTFGQNPYYLLYTFLYGYL